MRGTSPGTGVTGKNAKFADPEKLGIIQSRTSRTQWEQLHAEGHLRTNQYHGFDGGLQTKEVTAEGVDALNASILVPE